MSRGFLTQLCESNFTSLPNYVSVSLTECIDMQWKSAKVNDEGLVNIPKRWLQLHYYEALNILFRFENSLRVFVYAVLKNEDFDNWRQCSVPLQGDGVTTIEAIAKKRINQAESFGYLAFDIKAPLMHLTSGELVELITSDTHWPKFSRYFSGKKEIIKNKLHEIGVIRNSLAHFRPIKLGDIEVVKQNAAHTLLRVEQCLQNIFSQSLRVPTNTKDQWYKSIVSLKTPQVTATPWFSQDELWINVRLKFRSPLLGKSQFVPDFIHFVLAKINSPNILIHHPRLTKYLTYLSESVTLPDMSEELNIDIKKILHFVFRRDVFEEHYKDIIQDFEATLNRISEECELLQSDQLARGTIVESATVMSWKSKTDKEIETWKHSYHAIFQTYDPNHPDEYWGQVKYKTDIVSGCKRYPWMPEDISNDEGLEGILD